jgi:hypothetical protein
LSEQPGDPVLDGIHEAAHGTSDDRPAVGHSFASDDSVPLPARRARDDRSALVVRAEIAWRHETDGIRHAVAKRSVTHDDAGDSSGRGEELENALLLGEAADEENVWRIVGRADVVREGDSARHDLHVSNAQIACGVCERFRGTEHEPSAT